MQLTNLLGQTLDGKYYLDKLLGQGGMGAVFLATHIGTKRPVALKVIAPQFMANAEVGERFRREAEAAGRLRHPNVVNVTDFGVTVFGKDQLAYLVMEYLDGCSLGEMLKREKRLPLPLVVDFVEQVCLAIGNAHELGIIHRDLKPDNIWLQPDGRGGYLVKVLDFGLAKLRDTISDEAEELVQTDAPQLATQLNVKPTDTIRASANTEAQFVSESATQTQNPHEEIEAATLIQPATSSEPEAATLIQPSSANLDEAATLIQYPSTTTEIEATTVIQSAAVTQEAATQISNTGAEEPATQIKPASATQIVNDEATLIQTDSQSAVKSSQQKSATRYAQSKMATQATNSQGNVTRMNPAATVELTAFGSILGTPLYMSPEQCRGEHLDARSDIYSLGVIVYQMLAGETPFTGSMMELINLHSTAMPPDLKTRRADLPESLAALVMSTLAKNPEDRPLSAESFATALRVRSESEADVLRQAKAFYYAAQKTFFGASIFIYLPMAALSIGLSLAFDAVLSQKLGAAIVFFASLFVLLMICAHLNTALCAMIMEEARLSPTAKIKLSTILKNFLKRLPKLLLTMMVSVGLIFLNLLKLLLPGIKKYTDVLLAPSVAALENHTALQTLARSEKLAQPVRPIARSLSARDFGITLAAVIGFPSITSIMAYAFGGTRTDAVAAMTLPMIRNFTAGYSWFILALMHTVYMAMPMALLYFKAKQANGEAIEKTATDSLQTETPTQTDRMGKATLGWIGVPLLLFAYLIFSSLVNIGGSNEMSLIRAAREGRAATVERLLANGSDPNETRIGRTSALMYAAQDGQMRIVKLLVQAGAQINARDNDGDEALMYATTFGRAEIVNFLLAKGADVNARNNQNTTALIAAALRGRTDIVKALLAANADATVKDTKSKTALAYAEEEGHQEIVGLLKAAGATE
ncbi:MAG: ankyrin repeat domain-containing protein [Acidobacteriota bacterium]